MSWPRGYLVIDGKESGQESYQEAIMPGGENKLCILVLLKMEHGLSKKWEAGQIIMFSPIIQTHGWLLSNG